MREGQTGQSRPLDLYLDEIGEVPLLIKEQEQQLAQTIEVGRVAALEAEEIGFPPDPKQLWLIYQGELAKDHFIRANLRLVVSVAKRYPLPTGLELLDLIQEGNIGLEHAVDKFDWTKGFKFSTYATFWIRQAIGRALDKDGSMIRIPLAESSELRAAVKRGDDLTPTQEKAYRAKGVLSLDQPVKDGEEAVLGDFLPSETKSPDSEVLREAAAQAVRRAIAENLEPRTQLAVHLRFGIDDGKWRSYQEVGDELGLTGEQARRIVIRALRVLRSSTTGRELAALS